MPGFGMCDAACMAAIRTAAYESFPDMDIHGLDVETRFNALFADELSCSVVMVQLDGAAPIAPTEPNNETLKACHAMEPAFMERGDSAVSVFRLAETP